MTKTILVAIAALASATVLACASPTDSSAPAAADDELDAESITVGSWTLTALTPLLNGDGTVQAYMTIQGTPGTTGAGGVCLLKRTNTPCTPSGSTDVATDQAWLSQASQCGTKPFANGYWYCEKQGSDTSPTCAIRPGDRINYCAGSPSLIAQGKSPVFTLPTSTYGLLTPAQNVPFGSYYSYVCPGSCEASDTATHTISDTSVDKSNITTCSNGFICKKNPNG